MDRIKYITKKIAGVFKRYIGYAILISVFVVVYLSLNVASYSLYEKYIKVADTVGSEYSNEPSSDESYENADCNVAGVNLHGQLTTYIPQKEPLDLSDVVPADYISYYIKKAIKNPDIKAIVLEVDSGGGSPVAGEEIAHLLKTSSKPTVAVIRQMGTSAAYWASTGANIIFASKNSDIGSIGVTFSYLDNVGKNAKEGLNYVELFSGKYKESGNPDRTLTDEEKNLIMRDIKIIHSNFIKAVAQNRNLSVEKVSSLADGSSVLGEQAKKLGLIDRIGDLVDVEDYLSEKIGEKVEICWN